MLSVRLSALCLGCRVETESTTIADVCCEQLDQPSGHSLYSEIVCNKSFQVQAHLQNDEFSCIVAAGCPFLCFVSDLGTGFLAKMILYPNDKCSLFLSTLNVSDLLLCQS